MSSFTYLQNVRECFKKEKACIRCGQNYDGDDDGFTSQGNVAMKEASLEDEAQYAGAAHPFLLPSCEPEEQVNHLL